MKPLICFYENETSLFSEDYQLKTCPPNVELGLFLNQIEIEFPNHLKVIQMSFESLHSDLFNHQTSLYPCAKAHVFILNKYEILRLAEILKSHNFPAGQKQNTHWTLTESADSFQKKIIEIRKEISNGRLYQVNLTSALQSETEESALNLFCEYAQDFHGRYKALLPLPEVDVLCFSPELFLKKKNEQLSTEPIKGSIADQQTQENVLLESEKEAAELSMIVDLLRNDLNHLEKNKSAIVKKHRALLKLEYIQHTYSEICIETNQKLPAILESCFPGGSISGCPKTESLHVISEQENIKRQVYTGAIGWWQNSDFCLNLAIRTFIRHQNKIYYHAGCGIVYDSDAQKEWQEFLLKTGNLQK